MSLNEREPAALWEDAWVRLGRATVDRRHAFRHPVVATRCPRRGVRARTVVLRDVDASAAALVLHSDGRAEKIEGLEIEAAMSWCFYDPRQRLQLQAETRTGIHRGDAVARDAWSRQGRGARRLYSVEPAPATSIESGARPEFGEAEDDGFDHFAVIVCSVVELEWLLLAREGHRRLRFEPHEGDWRGVELVP